MGVPAIPDKLREPAVVTPAAFASYDRASGWIDGRPHPEVALLFYHRGLAEAVAERLGAQRIEQFLCDYFVLDGCDGRAVVAANFGIGAPAATFILEDLVHAGVRKVVSVGTTGALQPDLAPGDLLVCDRAIRDEGTSHHYAPADAPAVASEALTAGCADALQRAGRPARRGTAWTTDAPYRETALELRTHRDAGVLCVEMEAAALFTVGALRGIEVASMLVVSDVLTERDWTPSFHAEETWGGLHALVDAALEALQVVPSPA